MISTDELSRVWNQWSDRLLLVARAIGEPAEDAVQEAFIKLSLQPELPREPMAWLVRVVRNQLIQWIRQGERRRRLDQQAAFERPWFQVGGEATAAEADELTLALRQLPDSQREIVVLHLWAELSFDEISKIVDVSRSTAHRRYVEALDALRRVYQIPTGDRFHE